MHKLFIVNILSIIFFVIMPTFLLAAPVINSTSGQFDQGSAVTITGSGFGTKSQAAPLIWDNFDSDGADNGDRLDAHSNWTHYMPTDYPKYNNTMAHSGSFCIYSQPTEHNYWREFSSAWQRFTPSDEVYFTYWFRWNDTGSADEDGVGKLGRILSTDITNHYNGAGDTGIQNWRQSGLSGYGHHNPGTGAVTSGGFYIPEDTWLKIEMYKKVSTPGQSDGVIWMTLNGVVKWEDNSAMTRASGYSFQLREVLLPLMMASGGGMEDNEFDLDLFCDDVYVDNTRARVQIGNNPNFHYCDHSEIQIPTAWSNSSISFTVNNGSFTEGETAYLYVIDENGDVSSSYEIEIGAGGVGSEPADSVFAPGLAGDANNYISHTASRWMTFQEGTNIVYMINTTDYNALNYNTMLGEYSIYNNSDYDNFELQLRARSDEDLVHNEWSDYAVVFGFVNDQNYYYAVFENKAGSTGIYKIENGIRYQLSVCNEVVIQDNNFHNINVIYVGNILEILFDSNTIMTVNNIILPQGKIGFGSFNDMASFDDVIIQELLVEDVNGDGVVDINDVNIVRDQTLERTSETQEADVNRSGEVDVVDLQKVINVME